MATLTAAPDTAPREAGILLHAAEATTGSSTSAPVRLADQIAQTIVLAVLFAAPALVCVHAARVNDPDIWWHLRTGEWMLQHHAVPHVDLFSNSSAGKPWAAYSWLFELLTLGLFRQFGLVGIVGYAAGMVLAITVALQHLFRRLHHDSSVVALLTVVSVFCILPLFTPRPWMFSILFFVLEIDILMQARKTGRTRELAWLPVIFAFWANTHIQFVDGLFVLGLALMESLAGHWTNLEIRLRPMWIGGALLASLLATLLNPYGWRIYSVAFDLASQGGALNKITELQANRFRDLPDFCVLLLTLGAAAALTHGRRLRLFETALFVFAAILSFQSQRDVWLVTVVAVAILASLIGGRSRNAIPALRFATAAATGAAALAVLVGFSAMQVNNRRLETEMAKYLPVRAIEAIRAEGYAGPVYNDFTWGGYLIWALRMPVSIDGRASFYGDQAIDRSVATWNAEPDWASDPALMSAGIVVGPVKAPLVQVLRTDRRFQLVFADGVAAVFVAHR